MKADRVFVAHLRDGSVEIAFESGDGHSIFRISRDEAVSLANDLSPLQSSASLRTDGMAAQAIVNMPSVIPLPLLTAPITTASMTEYPDGLIVEMQLESQTAEGTHRRVRLPMFADTAQLLVQSIRERLERIGHANDPANKPLPS